MNDSALAEVGEIRRGLDEAFEALMDAADAGLRALDAGRPGEAREALQTVASACTFHDLAGQRLHRLAALLSDAPSEGAPVDALLFGPAHAGEALSEAELERLMQEPLPA